MKGQDSGVRDQPSPDMVLAVDTGVLLNNAGSVADLVALFVKGCVVEGSLL